MYEFSNKDINKFTLINIINFIKNGKGRIRSL